MQHGRGLPGVLRLGGVVLAVALVVACLGADARAERRSDDAKAAARAKVQEGAALFDAGDFAAALARFDEAYARFPAPAIHFNRAQALRVLGRNADAAQALERFLDEAKDASREKRAEAEQQLAELRRAGTNDTARAPTQTTPRAQSPAVTPAPVAPAPVASPPAAQAPTAAPATSDAGVVAGGGEPPGASLSHAGQLGLALRADVGVTSGGGAVLVPELTYGVGGLFELGAGALIGYYKGGILEARLFLLDARWKPLLTLGIPVFAVDGVQVGLQPGAGLVVEINSHLGVAAAATAVYFPSTPAGFAKLLFVPTLAIQGRL